MNTNHLAFFRLSIGICFLFCGIIAQPLNTIQIGGINIAGNIVAIEYRTFKALYILITLSPRGNQIV